MSQSRPAAPSRYQRSTGGLVAAMVVTVVAVVVFAGLQALNSNDKPTSVPTVDWSAMLRAGRADKKLRVMAPPTLPAGWKATSADYQTGIEPSWHLGMLTDQTKYVGVEEARGGVQDLVTTHVDADATPGPAVRIDGHTWQSWTDSGGDYAVSQSWRTKAGDYESWLVVGSAPRRTIRDLAASLRGAPAPVAGHPSG